MLVSLSIPNYGAVHINFMMDVIRLMVRTAEEGTTKLGINYVSSSNLLQGRHELAKKAVGDEADYLLFLDADMRFPGDTLSRLLAHKKTIVGANYTQRKPPHRPTAILGNKRLSSRGRSGLQEVDGIGLGCCLISTAVFKAMKKPWFMFGWKASIDDYLGEDVFCFARALEAGFKTFVDHDLSQEIRHIGEVELDVDMSAIG